MVKTADVVAGADIVTTWGNEIRDRTAQVFATAAERDAQWPAPPDGAVSYTADTAALWLRRAGAWAALSTLCHARAYRTADYSIPPTGGIVFPFETVSHDPAQMFDPVRNGFVIPIAGMYLCHGKVLTIAGSEISLTVTLNGATFATEARAPLPGYGVHCTVTDTIPCAVGDLVQIQASAYPDPAAIYAWGSAMNYFTCDLLT
jgi:hypothetical protein